MTSSWTDTHFASSYTTSPEQLRVYDFAETTGDSGSSYLAITTYGISSALVQAGYAEAGYTMSGACAITSAVSGTIYNIGGVSSEPTNHIIITMWGVNAYPGSYRDEDE
jgi:hypothetical protein